MAALSAVGSHAVGSHAVGSHAVGSHAVGSHAVGSHAVGSHAVGSHAVGHAEGSTVGAYRRLEPRFTRASGGSSCGRRRFSACGQTDPDQRHESASWGDAKSRRSIDAPSRRPTDAESRRRCAHLVLHMPPHSEAASLTDSYDDADDSADRRYSPALRQTLAVLALLNAGVATYLHLWKLGYMGALRCGAGHGCETVQLSQWGYFLGYDVALIGAVGYTLILIVALVGASERFVAERWPTIALATLVYPAFLFTLRLKHAEFIIMHTFCPWCAISAVTMTLFTVLVWLDWKRVR